MADNTNLNSMTGGDVISTDVITTLNGGAVATGEKAQRVKVGWGVDATFNDTSASSPLPVTTTNGALETGGNLATIVTNTNGVATAANQTTGNTSLSSIATNTGRIPALGSAVSAASTPVVIASDQTAIKVDGTATTQPVSGTLTVQQATASSLKVDLSGTAANATALKVDNSAVTQPVSGTVTATVASTTIAAPAVGIAGLSIGKVLSAATTNATSQKATQARLLGWNLTNTTASAKYVHLHNLTVAPTVGTSSPVTHIVIAPNSTNAYNSTIGITFSTGLSYSITGAAGDLDATAVAAGDVVGSLFYV